MEAFCLKLLKEEEIGAIEFLDVGRVGNNREVKVEERGTLYLPESCRK